MLIRGEYLAGGRYNILYAGIICNLVHMTVYRTIQNVGNYGERTLIGNGTWTWEAVRLIDGEQVGEHVALKDTWVYGHKSREGTKQILEVLLGKVITQLHCGALRNTGRMTNLRYFV